MTSKVEEHCFGTIESYPDEEMLVEKLWGVDWIFEARTRELNPCTKRNFHMVVRDRAEGPAAFWAICDAMVSLRNKNANK